MSVTLPLPPEDNVVWTPQPGSQQAFLSCPIWEVLYEGTRGPGKTDGLLMDYAQDVGVGWGAEWRGVLFRRTYPELSDIIAKSKKWFPRIFPSAKYNEGNHVWTFETGEELLFRHMARAVDYYSYHGHEYPWIGWEELTTWPTDECYRLMMSCSRSTRQGMPTKIRATTNPYGIGHNWVKARWKLPQGRWKLIDNSRDREGDLEPPRIAIPGMLSENLLLMRAQPNYVSKLRASARNETELKAWLQGDWNIVAGGMFDDVWDPAVHVLPALPGRMIPRQWRIDRSFDWGSSAPFSVGWYAQSNGEPIEVNGRTIGAVPGDIIRFGEWYGWTGKRNEGVKMLAKEVAQGILDREEDMDILGRVRPGPADSAIWDTENGNCVEADMRMKGVTWEKADKGPGSRVQGWEVVRKYLKGAFPRVNGEPREERGLFVTEACEQFIETIPVLPRSDKNLDDVDTEAEDHIGDEVRYRLRRKDLTLKRRVQ